MQIPLAVALPLLCRTPSSTQYTQFRQHWSDSTYDIAAFPPVNLFNCRTDFVFTDFVVGLFFCWLTWNILSHLELDLFLCSSIVSSVQLTPFELWVKAITHTLWVEAIPSATAVSSFPCFLCDRLLLITLTEMDGIHTVLRLDCVMSHSAGFKRK